MNNCILSSNSKLGNHSLKGTVSHKKEKVRSAILLLSTSSHSYLLRIKRARMFGGKIEQNKKGG